MSALKRLAELETKATPGPWAFARQSDDEDDERITGYIDYDGEFSDKNFQFVVEMRNSLPKFLRFVRAYDHWLELYTQDCREDLPDDGSLQKAVDELDSARKDLDAVEELT